MTDDFYECREWLDLRYRVLQKSAGSCTLCHCRAAPGNPLQIDHIKPRSKYPELALVESNLQVLCKLDSTNANSGYFESNLQVLCKNCNQGKSNKDQTDWRFRASRELSDKINRKTEILDHATPIQKAKHEQLSWLRKNDVDYQIKKEAEKQYHALWREIEADWLSKGVS